MQTKQETKCTNSSILKQKRRPTKKKKKMARRPKETFLQRRHTDGQETHEKMLNITNY